MKNSLYITKNQINRHAHKLCFFAAVLIWICALPQNVFTFGQGGQYEGYFVLILGTIFGPGLGRIGYFAVYANYIWFLLIFTSLIRHQSKKVIFTFHGLLWVVALLTFTLDEVIVDEAGGHAEPTYWIRVVFMVYRILIDNYCRIIETKCFSNF
ncbi:TPA: protein-(glutamine-N5) methyltransferase [Neisseria oralis]